MRRKVTVVAAFVLLAAYLGVHGASAATAPTVTGTSPSAAANTGPATISVQGTNFAPGAVVTLEKGTTILTATGATFDNSTSISGAAFDLYGASPGFWVVRVKNQDGSSGTWGDGASIGFHVVGNAPTISGITPTSVAQGTTQEITITGTNLARGLTATFIDNDDQPAPIGDQPANNIASDPINWDSLTQVRVSIHVPANAKTGNPADDLKVVNTDGQGATKTGALSVTAASAVTNPTVSSISPNSGGNTGSVSVTISGTGYHAGKVAVQLEKTGQSPIVMASPSVTKAPSTPPGGMDTITGSFNLALAAPGKWTVRVTNTDDHGTGTLADGFTVAGSTPSVTGVSPSTGNQGDQVGVTISGTNFANGAAVTLSPPDKMNVTNVNVVNSSTMTAVFSICAGAAPGNHSVTVTNTDGQSGTDQNAFSVSAVRPTAYSYRAYDDRFTGGASVAAGDIVPGCGDELVTGAGPGGGPHVLVAKPNQAGSGARVVASWFAYDPRFAGGVHVAVGEFDNNPADGDEVVTAPGPGGGPDVRIWHVAPDGSVAMIRELAPYPDTFLGGVSVAAGHFGAAGGNDTLVTGAGPGGGPHVRTFTFDTNTITGTPGFFAYSNAFFGGVNVAVGNFGSAGPAIVTGPGPGGGPDVEAFSNSGAPFGGFFAYSPGFHGGVSVAAGHVLGSTDQIITGPGPGGGPDVEVFGQSNGHGGNLGRGFFAYDPTFTGGVNVAVADTDGDGVGEIVTAPSSAASVLVAGLRLQ
jgi:hypothetical protein